MTLPSHRHLPTEMTMSWVRHLSDVTPCYFMLHVHHLAGATIKVTNLANQLEDGNEADVIARQHLDSNIGRLITQDMRQSKSLLIIDERGLKIARYRVFDCHLSPFGRQMAIENSVSYDFWSYFVDSIIVFGCRLPRVLMVYGIVGIIWRLNEG